MVPGASDETRRKNWQYTLAGSSAGRARHSKGVRCSDGILANTAVCELWVVRTSEFYIKNVSDPVCPIGSRRSRGDTRIGETLWWIAAHLTDADAADRPHAKSGRRADVMG